MKRLTQTISAINSGKKIPAVDLVKANPEIAAVISKMISPLMKPLHDERGNRTLTIPTYNNFTQISNSIMKKSGDVESIMQLFPDMELSAQILISSIISPKDMGNGEVNFIVPDNLIFREVSSPLLEIVKNYFEKDYKIQQIIPEVLRQTLFESGSYPIAVIPENSLDEFINGPVKISTESLSDFVDSNGKVKNIGNLGDPKGRPNTALSFSLESFNTPQNSTKVEYNPEIAMWNNNKSPVHVYDNPAILKFPQAAIKMRTTNVMENLLKVSKSPFRNMSTESYDAKKNFNDAELTSLIYKNRFQNSRQFAKINTTEESGRTTIGTPLILKLPSESVIPVFVPGQENKHVGYFILIDMEGNPIDVNSTMDHFGDLQTRLRGTENNDMNSYLMQRAKNMLGSSCPTELNGQLASKLYADVVEADLLNRLRNGVYGETISLGKNQHIYKIMFARALQAQRTNMLYVPADLITYFAYKYDKNGVGKSLLDDGRTLNSLRAMTMFSRVMASVKNSIGTTAVNLKLDENDPNPQKTIETAIHEISKTRQQYFPLGLNSPSDLVDWMQKAGYEFTFEGHPGIPDTSIQFSEKNSNYVKPDTDLDDELRKRAIMAVGLSPETVDNGFAGQFATSIVKDNILLTKRVLQMQQVFIPLFTDLCRKLIFNHGGIVTMMKQVVKRKLDEIKKVLQTYPEYKKFVDNDDAIIRLVVSEFISNFELTLPQPDTVTLDNQLDSFKKYEEAVDVALKYFISTEIMPPDLAGQIGEKAGDLQNMIKAHLMREWAKRNGFLNELQNVVNYDNSNEEQGILDILQKQKPYLDALIKSSLKLLNLTIPVGKVADQDLNKITDGEELEASAAPVEGSGPSDTSSDDLNPTDELPGTGDTAAPGNNLDTGLDDLSDL